MHDLDWPSEDISEGWGEMKMEKRKSIEWMSEVLGLSLLLSVAIFGCSDPRVANESTFRTALNQYFESHPPCIDAIRTEFPIIVGESLAITSPILLDWQKVIGDPLTKAGLLTKTSVTLESNVIGRYRADKYELTDAGKTHFRKNEGRQGGQFCAGKRTVKEIVNFTEPADMMGQRISQVTFTYTVEGVPEWLRSDYFPKKGTGLSMIRTEVSGTIPSDKDVIQEKAALMLTNKGWEVSSMGV